MDRFPEGNSGYYVGFRVLGSGFRVSGSRVSDSDLGSFLKDGVGVLLGQVGLIALRLRVLPGRHCGVPCFRLVELDL